MGLLLAGCGGKPRVWIVEGSAADRMTFGLSASAEGDEPLAVSSVQIHSCVQALLARRAGGTPTRDSTTWYADRWPPGAPAPELNRIAYGRVPAGMQEDYPAEPLRRPGCYVVSVVPAGRSGSAPPLRAGFRLQEDGSVEPLSAADVDSIFRPSPKPASG